MTGMKAAALALAAPALALAQQGTDVGRSNKAPTPGDLDLGPMLLALLLLVVVVVALFGIRTIYARRGFGPQAPEEPREPQEPTPRGP
jgi:hypothetical protein